MADKSELDAKLERCVCGHSKLIHFNLGKCGVVTEVAVESGHLHEETCKCKRYAPVSAPPTPADKDVETPEEFLSRENKVLGGILTEFISKHPVFVPSLMRSYAEAYASTFKTRVEAAEKSFKELDAIIDEEKVARSCINPFEDLRKVCRDLKAAESRLASLTSELEIARLAQFSPTGDNHHNALLCPYCNTGMKEKAREIAEQIREVGNLHMEWGDEQTDEVAAIIQQRLGGKS